MAFVLGKQASGQFVDQDGLAMIDEIAVNVSMNPTPEASRCLPFESTIKTRIELALQRAGIGVVEKERAAEVLFFSAIATYSGACAVSHSTQILVWISGFPMPGLALENGGIFSGYTATQSTQEVRKLADDAVDMVVNEVLKARRSRQ